MSDEPAYFLDVTGLSPEADLPEGDHGAEPAGRPWIGMHFECCGVYLRIYRNCEATAYEGRCPRCARPVHIRIGPGGTGHRMFRAR